MFALPGQWLAASTTFELAQQLHYIQPLYFLLSFPFHQLGWLRGAQEVEMGDYVDGSAFERKNKARGKGIERSERLAL